MKIIVINCGSSSIKYQLFEMDTHDVLAKGVVEKIGLHGSFIKNERNDGDKLFLEGDIYDHQAGIEYVLGISLRYGEISMKFFNVAMISPRYRKPRLLHSHL